VQGVAGNPFSVAFKQGVEKAAKTAKRIKLILGPFGDWTDSTSDSAVAAEVPSLPKIGAVISEGGEYGAVEALIKAGRPIPIAIGDNRGTFLRWWWSEYQKSHHRYNTESLEANPWVAGAGAYVALDILAGQKVRKTLPWPTMVITNPAKYRNISASSVATQAYNAAWVERNVIHGKG
jgi:ribose transport system substrate-binding protein